MSCWRHGASSGRAARSEDLRLGDGPEQILELAAVDHRFLERVPGVEDSFASLKTLGE
jgi:hypothetical protein